MGLGEETNWEEVAKKKPETNVSTSEPILMSFSEALKLLKTGTKIARLGWNGKGMFLIIAYPKYEDGIKSSSIEFNKVFSGVKTSLDNFIVMKTTGNTLVPWLASQTDILAEDWVTVTKKKES